MLSDPTDRRSTTNAVTGASLPSQEMAVRRRLRLLTAHYGLYQLPTAMAGGFAGAYLLKLGFSFPVALMAYAVLLWIRFFLRLAAPALIKRHGAQRILALGAAIAALQFIPLLWAETPVGLTIWIVTVSAGEALYWPIYHAMAAVTGGGASRGRELGLRTAVGATVGVIGPLSGGVLLQHFGPAADFAIAGLLCLLSAAPILGLEGIDVGPIPSLRDSLKSVDFSGVAAFAADGWLCSGLALAWPMTLFVSLGSQYESFGAANAAAGLIGAIAGLICGDSIDRGGRDRYLTIVSAALMASFALRAAAGWSTWAAILANVTGGVVTALYTPVLMTGVYERAKNSGAAYRFHFTAEAGWDAGASLGCLAGAAAAWATDAPSLSMLPAALGIFAFYACVRSHGAHARSKLGPAPSGALT